MGVCCVIILSGVCSLNDVLFVGLLKLRGGEAGGAMAICLNTEIKIIYNFNFSFNDSD